jgi:hypothetical protein
MEKEKPALYFTMDQNHCGSGTVHQPGLLIYNEPDWHFPEVDENSFHFESSALGHPLIPGENRVNQ